MKRKEERNEFSKDVMDKLCIHVKNIKRNRKEIRIKGRGNEGGKKGEVNRFSIVMGKIVGEEK